MEKITIGSKLCPRCQDTFLDPRPARNALSRKDNKTIICSDCGTAEAIEELLKGGK